MSPSTQDECEYILSVNLTKGDKPVNMFLASLTIGTSCRLFVRFIDLRSDNVPRRASTWSACLSERLPTGRRVAGVCQAMNRSA